MGHEGSTFEAAFFSWIFFSVAASTSTCFLESLVLKKRQRKGHVKNLRKQEMYKTVLQQLPGFCRNNLAFFTSNWLNSKEVALTCFPREEEGRPFTHPHQIPPNHQTLLEGGLLPLRQVLEVIL